MTSSSTRNQASEATMATSSPWEGRDISLLPRHWAWLAAQSRRPAAILRLLIEEASRDRDGRYRKSEAKEACYLLMRDSAGDRAGFEHAVRALFAGDAPTFHRLIALWPVQIRDAISLSGAPVWARSSDVETL